MKRLSLFMAMTAMLFVSCNQMDEPLDPTLELSKSSLTLSEDGEATFDVTSNQNWTASADASWVELLPSSGEASDTPVTVTVTAKEANPSSEARTAVVTVTAGELTETVSVSQPGTVTEAPSYEVDGKQWVFEWMYNAPALFDLGATTPGTFYFAVDMAMGPWYPYYSGTYTIEKGENNAGTVKIVLVDPMSGTEMPFDVPYVMTAEDAVTFDTSALESLLTVASVEATLSPELIEISADAAFGDYIEVDATSIGGDYYGGMAGSYNYYIELSDGYYTYYIDLYSDVAVGEGAKIVPEGEYDLDYENTRAAGTFSSDKSYVLVDGVELAIEDGWATVYDDGIELDLFLEDGSEHYVWYGGVPDLDNSGQGTEESVSTLDGDLGLASENGLISAEGAWDEDLGCYWWYVYVYADTEAYPMDCMAFELLTEDTELAGEYVVYSDELEELAGCFLPGEYEMDVDGIFPYYSWYLQIGEEGYTEMAPITEGELLIEKGEDGTTYTVMFDLYDDKWNNIAGSITGEGDVYVYDNEPAAAMKRNPRKALALRK